MLQSLVMSQQTIQDILKAKGLTMADIARSIDISESYVNLVIHGKRQPRITTAIKMAQYLGLSVETFVRLLPLP